MIFDHKQTINIVNHLFIHFMFLTRILNYHNILLFHTIIDIENVTNKNCLLMLANKYHFDIEKA